MKRMNRIMIGTLCLYIILMLGTGIYLLQINQSRNREYLVEVNRIMLGMEETGNFFMPDLHEYEYIREVSFLDTDELERMTDESQVFFERHNGRDFIVQPLVLQDMVLGLVRFDYINSEKNSNVVILVEVILGISCLLTLAVLLYIRMKVLKPFSVLSDMPYELSKGRLETELNESKNRYFGKFIWGISMLKDNLKSSQMKSLRLEREKKMLFLSISHDIKTPLNTINLYARALRDGMYDTTEKQEEAAEQIEELSGQIEGFVKDIIKTSHEEVVAIEVEKSEFYLKDLMKMAESYYTPKCRLIMTELQIAPYENRLLNGNQDSAFEAMQNIFENALKYGDGKCISISCFEEDYCQLIRIHNSGVPTREEELPHLFDSFFRGSNASQKEGNGLGLYICREIMHKMDGDIFATKQNDGMDFTMVFRIV